MSDTDTRPPAPGREKSARRLARELALKGLYQWLVASHSVTAIEDTLKSEEALAYGRADRELLHTLLRGSIDRAEALQADFAGYIDRAVTELSPIERAVLLLATFELRNHPDVPYRVVINEAIELTKEYGGTDGHRFVNGVLDKLAAQLRADEFSAARGR